MRGRLPFPHPDNIKIDMEHVRVGVRGGFDREKFDAREELRRMKRELPELLAGLKLEMAVFPDDPEYPQLIADGEADLAICSHVPDEEPWVFY